MYATQTIARQNRTARIMDGFHGDLQKLGDIPTSRSEMDEMREEIRKISKRNQDATKRLHVHLIFIILAGILGTAATLIPALIPFASILTTLPGVSQEVTDWIKGW